MAIAPDRLEEKRRQPPTPKNGGCVYSFIRGIPDGSGTFHIDPHASEDRVERELYIEFGKIRAEKPLDLSEMPKMLIGVGRYRKEILDLKSIR